MSWLLFLWLWHKLCGSGVGEGGGALVVGLVMDFREVLLTSPFELAHSGGGGSATNKEVVEDLIYNFFFINIFCIK